MNFENETEIEKQINENGFLVIKPKGYSMLPLIKQKRDTVIIQKPNSRLQKNSVALYKRKNGTFVLHRVVKVTDSGYVMCGDNQYELEYGINDDNIIGVMASIIRGNKELKINDIKYKLYVFLWCSSLKLRKFVLKSKELASKIKHKKNNL